MKQLSLTYISRHFIIYALFWNFYRILWNETDLQGSNRDLLFVTYQNRSAPKESAPWNSPSTNAVPRDKARARARDVVADLSSIQSDAAHRSYPRHRGLDY